MSAEFWTSYRAIGAKLKKRFFRKVNVTDARDLYGDLVASLRREGNHQYAAFCSLAVARCAQSAGNATTEAERTWEAAQMFLKTELDANDTDYTGFEEYMVEAIHCYLLAIERYEALSRAQFAAMLCTELADGLLILGHASEALLYYERAARLLTRRVGVAVDTETSTDPLAAAAAQAASASATTTTSATATATAPSSSLPSSATTIASSSATTSEKASALSALQRVVECRIALRDYDGALETLNHILALLIAQQQQRHQQLVDCGRASAADEPGCERGAALEHLCSAEVSRLLLLLLLQPAATYATESISIIKSYMPRMDDMDDMDDDADAVSARALSRHHRSPRPISTAAPVQTAMITFPTPHTFLQDDLFLLLQSMVLACSRSDVMALRALQGDLWSMFSPLQNDLVHQIIESVETSA